MRREVLAFALAGALACGLSHAQNDPPAPSRTLDDLLELIQEGSARDDAEAAERERIFQERQADQDRLLQEANTRKASEEARSGQLEMTFEENERLIADVRAQLDSRLGALRELFGVLQQVSGDARGQFQNSLTNVEYPERGQFLSDFAARMGQSSRLASIEEIERLWFELQREATELGKVKRLPGFRVIAADGQEIIEDVVRVGAFNIVADGRYLRHNPDTNSLSELPRQPAGRFLASASDLVRAGPQDGMISFGIDPTRGQLLSLLTVTPTFYERLHQGGAVGYVIMFLGVVGLLLCAERLFTLGVAEKKVRAQLNNPVPSADNPLGRVLQVYDGHKDVDTETLELKLGEAILKESSPLQRGILFIKVISVVAPLLGLLGTVTGMIQTFQAIMLYGTGDPTVMAGGIALALVTTVQGLIVAIPTVLLHSVVAGRSRRIVQILQEQSAGIVAEHAEKLS